MIKRIAVLSFAFVAASAGAQASKPAPTKPAAAKPATTTYKTDVPDSLARQAKITEAAAAATALAKVPKGRIESVELEREYGKLLYSYDIKVPGKAGIDEVRIDAVTGTMVGAVEHESPAAEKKEAADEAKEKKAKPARAQKPPHP